MQIDENLYFTARTQRALFFKHAGKIETPVGSFLPYLQKRSNPFPP